MEHLFDRGDPILARLVQASHSLSAPPYDWQRPHQLDFVAVFTAGSYNAGGSAPNKIMTTVILPKLLAASDGKSLAAK
jgi:hypothetical protein